MRMIGDVSLVGWASAAEGTAAVIAASSVLTSRPDVGFETALIGGFASSREATRIEVFVRVRDRLLEDLNFLETVCLMLVGRLWEVSATSL